MAEGAGALETRSTFNVCRQQFYPVCRGRCKVRRCRAINGNDRLVQRCRNMHQAGVVADHGLRRGEQINRLTQAGPTGQILTSRQQRGLNVGEY